MRNLKIAISLLFFSFISVQAVHANFTVIQRALNPYQLKSTDIWGLDIMSTETQAVNVKFYGTISKDGVPVVKLESRAVQINPGANALTSFNVSSSKINYLNKNISEIERLTLSLPPGSYQYCVYLRCATVGCEGLGTPPFDLEKIYCTNVQVEPPTPLQLAYPGNESKIKETRPGLNWIPPGPIVQSSKLKYIITLVEMNDKQNRMDAIKRNRPLLRKRGHSLNTLMFPLDLNELEVGKSYAWQVEAWVGDQWLSTSEVWEFEIEDEKEDKDPPQLMFYRLKDQIGLETYTHNFNDTLALTAEENYINDETKTWRVTAKEVKTGKEIDLSTGFASIVHQGKYNLQMVISDYYLLEKGKIYVITVTNSANQKKQIRIQLK